MNQINKLKIENYLSEKIVYFNDLISISSHIFDEEIENSRGEQFCCKCIGPDNESNCKCISRKEKRDGTPQNFMRAGMVNLETAEKIVADIAHRIIVSIREKSFECECAPALMK